MFSQTTEYALRAVVWLASRHQEPLTTAEIAKGTQVPEGYLSKVLQSLGRGGIVRAQRGKNGGFVLVKAPGELSILEVVQAVDPIRRIRECPLGLAAHGRNLCSLHRRMDNILLATEEAFRDTTIGALLEEPSESMPLCVIGGAVNAA